jgi:hypothetical protein
MIAGRLAPRGTDVVEAADEAVVAMSLKRLLVLQPASAEIVLEPLRCRRPGAKSVA